MAALLVRRQIPIAFAFVLPVLSVFLCFIVNCHFNVSGFVYSVKRDSLFTSTKSIVTA